MINRIPVYLLTGYLGSGKTSLLKNWLTQPEFKNAALIINELGEVGLDNQLLSAAIEPSSASTLIANACVCCTGLPGLEQALEDLFWARLERRIPKFDCVVVETTGLAQASPIIQTMTSNELLAERFNLAAIVTCVSAATADEVLNTFDEARDQLHCASVVVLTKIDLVESGQTKEIASNLELRLGVHHSTATVLYSANANLLASEIVSYANQQRKHPTEPDHHHHHNHDHALQAHWWAISATVNEHELLHEIQRLQAELGNHLFRLKGIVASHRGTLLIEVVPFETKVAISLYTESQPAVFGLTIISSQIPNLKNYSTIEICS
jgi:G3E family GTPase